LNRWLQRHYLAVFDEILSDGTARLFRHLDRSAVLAMRGRPVDGRPREDLYALLVLELWLRKAGL